MNKVSAKEVKELAHRLMFDMTEEDYAALSVEIDQLHVQMEKISSDEELNAYEPMTFPFECSTSYLREDEPTTPLDRDEALSNSGSCYEHQIKLPKVVG